MWKPAIWCIALAIVAALVVIRMDWLARDEVDGEIVERERPREFAREQRERQRELLAKLESAEETRRGELPSVDAARPKQILFGDFHVHTTFSFDAFLANLPMAGGAGSRPPSDACDFARYCSALDFWSINDHAENLTPDLWRETVAAVRRCNEVAGDPSDPDLVTYLGWEWSQIGSTPANHYGHKNVVLLETGEGAIPRRPIASRSPAPDAGPPPIAQSAGGIPMRLGLLALNGRRGLDFARFLTNVADTPRCPDGVPVRALPDDCRESVETPEELFAKLDEWGFPALVIPHGTAWGLYTPAGSDWRKQLAGHDPERQKLIEVYSGHGNSEQFPEWREVDIGPDGAMRCPPPHAGYLPSCVRAGALIEERCLEVGETAATCAARAADAQQNYVEAFQAGWRTLPGFEATDWLDAGQAPGGFQPAFNYRPRSSVQYMLAIRDFSDPDGPKRFDFGFLGSSDNHNASPGTGYKEFARGEMTEGRGGNRRAGGRVFGGAVRGERVAESVPYVPAGESPLQLFEVERQSAYFVTGGLVATHSTGRDRASIWESLERREVYATSGRRILLWFDLLTSDGVLPMGSKTAQDSSPRFRVRAAGSFEQRAGCPDDATAALGPARVAAICRGECYHPGDVRRPITRIEVVRIRPQVREDEDVRGLIEDPWRTLTCPGDGAGCLVEFSDDEFASAGRDTVYYVRAIEAPDLLIHGADPLRCEYDAAGRCVSIDPCGGAAAQTDDCLGEAEPRAWSSPIYVDFAHRAGEEVARP